jgi:hypothetical protein
VQYPVSSITSASFQPIEAYVCVQDAPLAALYVSTKMQDTLKKPRDILMVYYTVRSPELLAKWKSGVDLGIDETVMTYLYLSAQWSHC